VAIAFKREHQPVVDTWIAGVEPLLAQDPEFRSDSIMRCALESLTRLPGGAQ